MPYGQDTPLAVQSGYGAGTPVADPAAAYAALPWYQKIPQAADDTVRLVTDGFTGGYADKAAAGLNSFFGLSPDYATALAQQRQASADAQGRAGTAGYADQVAGTIAGPGKVMDAAAGVLKGAPLLGNALMRASASGAGVGAFDASGHDQDVGTGALVGAGAGAAGNVVGDAVTKGVDEASGLFNKVPPTLDAAGFKAQAQQLYNSPLMESTIVNPDAVERLNQAVRQRFVDQAYDPLTHPGAGAILNVLDRNAGQNVTLKGLDTIRKVAGNVAGNQGSDSALGNATKSEFDTWAQGLKPSDMVGAPVAPPPGSVVPPGSQPTPAGASDPQAAIDTLKQAQSLWQRQSKLQDVEDLLEKAQDRASTTYSGGNGQNATAQNAVRMKWGRDDWTPDEQAALQTAIAGTNTSNLARAGGKLLGGGGGMHGFNTALAGGLAGYSEFGVPGAIAGGALPVVGTAASKLGSALTSRAVQNVQSVIANGGQQSAVSGVPNLVQQFARAHPDALRQTLTGALINAPRQLQPNQ